MLNLFSNISVIYVLYLLYGAVFLFLGVAIVAKDMKGSDLKLADKLWMLALFGFLHGIHEWLDLGPMIEGENMGFHLLYLVKVLSTTTEIISFICLLQFGVSLVRVLDVNRIRWAGAIPAVLAAAWVSYVWWRGLRGGGQYNTISLVIYADAGARLTFCFVGALLTAYGLIAYSREVIRLSRSTSTNLMYAGIMFSAYAVFGGLFPSSPTQTVLPVPAELLRGASAFFITYFISKALNIFDIEARRKMELQTRRLVQAEKLTSLGQLAAGIAHEINSPLTNASLGIQALKTGLSTNENVSEAVKKLDAVEKNIDRASMIAQELLQFSRQREMEFIPLNVNKVIDGALTLLHYKLNGVEIRKNLTEIPDIMGDPGKLEQVFINVLSNSLEAMPEGGSITLASSSDERFVHVRIEDTGVGIADEHVSRVFDPFFTTKEIGQGTGLGLSLCYGIIQQHHGTIHISSEADKGTSVTIRLPNKEHYEKDTHR
ncbi:MAG TPA: ATP-binding protein [Nitrospirota bacterium]|nr:ATP-binding protein [Nitrospirota bacterium]